MNTDVLVIIGAITAIGNNLLGIVQKIIDFLHQKSNRPSPRQWLLF